MVADVDAYLHGRATITTIATRWLADQRAVSALHRVGHVVAGDPARAAAAVDGLRAACDAATGARDDVDDRWAAAERATRTDDRTRPLADLARLLTRHDRSR